MPKAKWSLSLHWQESTEESGCLRNKCLPFLFCSAPTHWLRSESERQMQKPRWSIASPATEKSGHVLTAVHSAAGTCFRSVSPFGVPHSCTCTSTQEQKQQLTAPRQASVLPAVRRGLLLEKAKSRITGMASFLLQVMLLPCWLWGCARLLPLPWVLPGGHGLFAAYWAWL